MAAKLTSAANSKADLFSLSKWRDGKIGHDCSCHATHGFGMTELIISQVVNGLVLGFLYVLIAIGLSIIFGMLGIVNFAHGVFFALGAYFALTLQDNLGPWAIVLAPLGVGILGMVVEATLMRPLYGKDPLLGLFMTFGIALFCPASLFGDRSS
jgi:branched-chain amino acid transport system permease protein